MENEETVMHPPPTWSRQSVSVKAELLLSGSCHQVTRRNPTHSIAAVADEQHIDHTRANTRQRNKVSPQTGAFVAFCGC